ncbi:MAG: hotdog fold thioesterase [Herbiconiux sp.]|uniref:PaaI family thioesterase n=1 Tax=Herbiconiux sp. TaxID=1871186 RepID=UPI00120D6418|nr:hotdog fold thioesterase [Herbiconiux sp.]TAJ46178.1 MAG: hotdog fold thioesterase [Herbiconiux sp.]
MTQPEPLPLDAMKAYGFEGVGELAERMGIEFLELSAERAVARMPVAGNTQPVGLLHGGASVVLAESLGSTAAALHAGPERLAMGIEINASHSGAVTEGWVTGVCTPIHLGRTLATHQIEISDERGRRVSTVRITNILTDRKK